MARRRGGGRILLQTSVRGAGRVARDFDRAQREIQDALNREIREYGIEAEAVLKDAAPEDTGQLIDHIRAVPYFRAIRPRLQVVVDRLDGHSTDGKSDGYDYLGVTLRGHRRRTIRPARGAVLQVHYAGHRNASIFVYRAAVTGVRRRGPSWVDQADQPLRALERGAERRLGRRVERSLRS